MISSWNRALECCPIPARQVRRRFVAALQEREQAGIRIGCLTDVVVAQQELAQFLAVPCRGRPNRGIGQAGRGWRRVGVKRRLLDRTTPRPEAATDHFVGIRLARDAVGTWPWRGLMS